MPRQTQKGGLTKKLGRQLVAAHEEHKSDSTSYGSAGELPPGIENGIAELTECKFDTFKSGDNQGEYYFLAMGVVKRPVEHDVVRCEGRHTMIMEPLCDTPNRTRQSVSDHLGWVYNELRKLGVDTEDIDPDQLEDVAEALKASRPHFRFRTWRGEANERFPNPRTNHEWLGETEYDEEADEDVTDETPPTPKPSSKEPDVPFGDDLDMLADRADNEDDDAIRRLNKMALKAGFDQDAIDEAESWNAVAELIRQSLEATKLTRRRNKQEEDEEEGEEEFIPGKGEVYLYRPPKSKRKMECDVTAVFQGKQTVNLKNLDTGKIYKSVSWDKLEGVD